MKYDNLPEEPIHHESYDLGYEQGRADALNEIMPILITIVNYEGYCYGYGKEIDKLELEFNRLKEQK